MGEQAGRDPEVPGWEPPGSVKKSLLEIIGDDETKFSPRSIQLKMKFVLSLFPHHSINTALLPQAPPTAGGPALPGPGPHAGVNAAALWGPDDGSERLNTNHG